MSATPQTGGGELGTELPQESKPQLRVRQSVWQRRRERMIESGLGLSASVSVCVTVLIVWVLFRETVRFFQHEHVQLRDFFFSTRWAPLFGGKPSFGVWALVCGTFLVTGVAMLVALPMGLISAVYLSEYAPRRVRAILKPALEVLAGIPTVVYGFFALTAITPVLQKVIPGLGVYNALSAGIAVGILCLPTVASLAEDALQAVPQSLREAAYGLGGTRFDVATKVVVPAAMSGIVSAGLLAVARAIGETMAVALAAGSMAKFTFDPRDEVQTMTGFMVQMALGDVSNYGVEYLSMYAVAAVLFGVTLMVTLTANLIRRRYREAYE
jgi:phosphate transport system permease protein